ncbi:MAG: AMP-binding protein [Acidobacteria bacterium]|nr:AMP-binding protein [Acidobacteriota bacterium]MCW5970029.1 AMP-binding protein [Blastocatellales bacterium]
MSAVQFAHDTADVLSALQRQIAHNYTIPFYRKRMDEWGVRPEDIRSFDDFRRIPMMKREDQVSSVDEDPPLGSMWNPDAVLITHTPAPGIGLVTEYHTRADIDACAVAVAKRLAAAGVTKDDIVVINSSYHLVISGHTGQAAFTELGAKVLPLGPGETERQVEIINRLGATVLFGFPSYCLKLAEAGARGKIRVMIAGGEPFSSIEGRREQVKNAFGGGITAVDLYGLSGFNVVAMEDRRENGMRILEDEVYAEIIDPETGDLLPYGERGELVLTHVNRQAMPFMRFRTGDLTVLDRTDGELYMPNGVFGRTGEMYRVKGLKFYPSVAVLCLAGIQGVHPLKYRFTISRPSGTTDYVKFAVQGNPSAVDAEVVKKKIGLRTLFEPNEVEIIEQWVDGPTVVDERGGVDR